MKVNSTRFKVAVAAGGVLGAVLVGGFGPMVRHEAGRVAERYGGAVAIGHVVPTWHGARLRDVDVTLAEVPSARIHLDEVEVAYGSDGRTIALRGGMISAVGPREVVIREAEAWRSRHSSSSSANGEARSSGNKTEIAGFALSWKNDAITPTEAVTASGVRVSREAERIAISAAEASVALGRTSVQVRQGRLELVRRAGGGHGIAELSAQGLTAQLALPAKAEGTDSTAAPVTPVTTESPRASRIGSLREALVTGARGLDALLEPKAKVHVDGVHAHVQHGRDQVTLGPGRLEVTRSADSRLEVELAPELPANAGVQPAAAGAAPEAEQALTFKLSVPLGAAGTQEIVAAVQGGPIGLSSLGVKDGDFGLFDVAKTSIVTRSRVVLAADGASVSLDGEGRIRGLSLRAAALSDEPVAGLELAFRAKGDARLDGSKVHVDEGEVDLGDIRVLGRGDYERVKGAHRVKATFDVPLTACQAMLDAVPKGLVPKLAGMRMAGSFGLKGKATFDTANLDRGYVMDWDVANTCRITEVSPEVHVERFRQPFQRTVLDPDNKPVRIDSGPGTPGWAPFGAISKYMEVALLTTEDAGFHRHHGFDQEAIRNSIRENLRKKRFVRGASTLSMQLAKNLYLDRTKNLARKLQEAVLTMYLEQELTKEQILELYLNVVEFGPMVYGIGPAARHYFNTSAADLSLGQALYISSILPNPKNQHFIAGGEVAPGWMNYLYKLMKIAHQRHRIADDELEEGLRETVVRGQPAPRKERDAATGGDGDGPIEPEPPVETGDWLGP